MDTQAELDLAIEAANNDYLFWRTSSHDWAKWLLEDMKKYEKDPTKENAEEVDSDLANLQKSTEKAMEWLNKVAELRYMAA